MPYATLGSMIRYLRKQNDMTQAVLAQKVGVTDKAVSKWERELSYPDISLFPRLADVLGVTADDLLREFIDEEKPSRLLQIFKMSHDLRTPLHIMLGYAKMAELHCEEPEKLTKYLAGIRVSGEYLLKVLDYVLDVSHLDDRMDLKAVWWNCRIIWPTIIRIRFPIWRSSIFPENGFFLSMTWRLTARSRQKWLC